MGDADNEVVVPVEELEQWMDEALEVVDEGLESLVDFIAHLNLYKNQISLRLKNVENFSRFFSALNVLVIPVVIALLISFGASSSHEILEGLLICFSGFIGLPFYLFSAWQYYSQEEKVKEEWRQLSKLSEFEDDYSAMLPTSDSLSNFLSAEVSVERLHDFARLLSNRMMDRARLETGEASRSPEIFQEDKLPVCPDISASDSVEDTNSLTDVKAGKQDPSEVKANKSEEVNFPVLYQFQIRAREQSPNLEVKIEPCDDEKEEPINTAENLPCKEQSTQQDIVGDLVLL